VLIGVVSLVVCVYGAAMNVAYLSVCVSVAKVHIRSTDYDRTLMSAYSNLAGLFPPEKSQVWNDDLLWQPVPVHTEPLDSDHVS